MKNITRILLALATLSLSSCEGVKSMLSGKDVSVSYKDLSLIHI